MDSNGAVVPIFLSASMDVVLPSFTAADLTLEYNELTDVGGFTRIDGNIGGGQMDFITDRGVIISGPIKGGPEESNSFSATGTWVVG
jgi:hypothetical protein